MSSQGYPDAYGILLFQIVENVSMEIRIERNRIILKIRYEIFQMIPIDDKWNFSFLIGSSNKILEKNLVTIIPFLDIGIWDA